VEPWEVAKDQIDGAKARGNKHITVTGGEPTMYPEIVRLVKYVRKQGMSCEIITNGVASIKKIEQLVDAGVTDWLMSMHGTASIHDKLVELPGARKLQARTILTIGDSANIRANCVVNRLNQEDLIDYADMILSWREYITAVNFINFNPHLGFGWDENKAESMSVIANLRFVERILPDAIGLLEEYGIGVNLRCFPMCMVAEQYRRCVCNCLHVLFDPWEWDYCIEKDLTTSIEWCQLNSQKTECKENPCDKCDLLLICGGINRVFNQFTDGKMIDAVTDFEGDKADFYWYRGHNEMTLAPQKGR
jgi:sulfatase maturation enzyme AslB (radical SAM superfamily)